MKSHVAHFCSFFLSNLGSKNKIIDYKYIYTEDYDINSYINIIII